MKKNIRKLYENHPPPDIQNVFSNMNKRDKMIIN